MSAAVLQVFGQIPKFTVCVEHTGFQTLSHRDEAYCACTQWADLPLCAPQAILRSVHEFASS